ncbi:Hypothetical predicted protein [Lecanosticta acicola]|uniref:Thioester reductase (TE) domain-containing protein n=1 Tax=Lecanosticta acicola TaxID=111012 RepID=A0AAI9EDS0_9PEZI|nr:Hypothetical predicted protein [Lecanosticta acicola]
MPDLLYADHMGYDQAKLVCEKLLEQAASDLAGGVELTCARVGQISGSTKTGIWNETEHFPALLKGSQMIGKLPKVDGMFSWISADIAAEAICDIALQEPPPRLVYQIENPNRQSWRETIELFAKELQLCEVVPPEKWVSVIRKDDEEREATLDLRE